MSVPESQAWREMVESHPDVRCPYCADGQCDRCAAGVCECECRAGDSLREAIDAAMGVAEEPTGGKPE